MLDQTTAIVLLVIVLACAVVASAALARRSLAPLRHTKGASGVGVPMLMVAGDALTVAGAVAGIAMVAAAVAAFALAVGFLRAAFTSPRTPRRAVAA